MSDWITVTVAATKGSTPRDAGATMLVWPDRIEGTIGGGAAEWAAIAHARVMLAEGRVQDRTTHVLGPENDQCCGGRMELDFIAGALGIEPTTPVVWVWGAGHIGRALVSILAGVEELSLTWVDDAPERFPPQVPPNVHKMVAADPAALAADAPKTAHHAIVTYSHALDFALCDALLSRGFASAGLIGSDSKWARFRSRLEQMGHSRPEIGRIACPIGEKRLGKHPTAIAVGVAYGLLMSMAQKEA